MSTIDPDLPANGTPYNPAPIRENFVAAASDIAALENLNAGDSAPSSPVLGTLWLDSSAGTTYTLRIWNDRQSQWVTIADLDSLNSLWIPPVGGGEPVSLLADDTTDLGAYPQTVETITGAGPIYSFGTTSPAGIVKVLTFTGATNIVYNATSMLLPGGADINTLADDMAIAVALGAGNWQVLFFQSAALAPAGGGTGRTSLTAHGVLIGEGTDPINVAAPSSAPLPLLSGGLSSDPAFGLLPLDGVSVTGVLRVIHGGTGLGLFTKHNMLVGNGTNPATLLPPGTIAYPLVSRGPMLDPYYAVLTPAGGGTGLTAITAHNLIIGNGTSSTLLPPGTTGLPLVSQGAAADPAYGRLTVPGGGTGLATIPTHAVMLGEGTGNIATAAPGATGIPLLSTGASSDPAFSPINLGAAVGVTGVLPVANGGSGVATIPVGSILQGNGTMPLFLEPPATADYPLTSNGALSQPSFRAVNLAGAGVTGWSARNRTSRQPAQPTRSRPKT